MGFLDYIASLTAQQWFFFLFAALAVGSALEVVMQRNPLYSAIALIFTFAALAANYVLLKAQFIAAIQIIVYAGAIIVLFVFVIMLLNVRTEESRLDRYTALKWLVTPSIVVLLGAVMYVIRTSQLERATQSANAAVVGTVETIGKDLFTKYLVPFEAASVLIMMAIVGALVLAQRALASPSDLRNQARAELNQAPVTPAEEPEKVEA
jgi:NADH-quinone oxidoreductase subunit J